MSRKLTKIVVLSLDHHTCNRMIKATCWLGSGAACSSTLLFLLRVNCVFFDSRRARMLFTALWILASLSLLSVPFSYYDSTKGPDGLCIVLSLSRFVSIPSFTIGVFDMTVFISISHRITAQCINHTWWKRCITFFTATEIGLMSRALLRTGQLYFL